MIENKSPVKTIEKKKIGKVTEKNEKYEMEGNGQSEMHPGGGMKKALTAIYFSSFSIYFISVFMALYSQSLGVKPMGIGSLYAVFGLVNIVTRTPMGIICEKRGRRFLLILSAALLLIQNCLFALGGSYYNLLIADIAGGIGLSGLMISGRAMALDIAGGEDEAIHIARVSKSANKGSFVGATAGFFIIGQIGTEVGYTYAFALYILTSIISVFYAFKSNETIEVIKGKMNDVVSSSGQRRVNFTRELINVQTMKLMMYAMFGGLVGPIYMLFVAEKFNIGMSEISILFVPQAIIMMSFAVYFGNVANKLGTRKGLAYGMILVGASTVLLLVVGNFYIVMAVLCLESVGILIYGPSQTVFVRNLINSVDSGKLMGEFSMLMGLSAALGNFLGGALYGMDHRLPFIIAGIACIAIGMNFMVGKKGIGDQQLDDYLEPSSKKDAQDHPLDLTHQS